MDRHRQRLTKQLETFTSWAVTSKETGVGGGRDHHGGIRTDPRLESATAGETKLIHNTLWGEVDLSARMQDS